MILVFYKQTKQLKQTSLNINLGSNNDTELVLANECFDEIILTGFRRLFSRHKEELDSLLPADCYLARQKHGTSHREYCQRDEVLFRPFKKTFQLGRSEREPEAYGSRYVEGLSE